MKDQSSQKKIIIVLAVIIGLCLLVILLLFLTNRFRGGNTPIASVEEPQEAAVDATPADDIIPVSDITAQEDSMNAYDQNSVEDAIITDKVPPSDNTSTFTTTEPASGKSVIGDSGLDNVDLPFVLSKVKDVSTYDEVHTVISGYWLFDTDKFVGFIYQDGVPWISYGLLRTTMQVDGQVITAKRISDHEVELTIKVQAQEETMVHEAKPERTEVVRVDFSNYNDNRLNISVVGLYDNAWNTYEFGAGMLEDLLK